MSADSHALTTPRVSERDVTFLIPFYTRLEHFQRYYRGGMWDDVSLQLVCDGSPDDLVRRLQALVSGRADVGLHTYGPNRGLARARGEGFQQIHTPFVALCDDDDYIPNAAAYARRAAEALRKDPGVLLVAPRIVGGFRQEGRAARQYDRRWMHGRTGENLLNFIVRTGEINALVPSVYRTEDVRTLEVTDLIRTNEDLVMLARLCARHPGRKIHVLEDAMYMRLLHGNSISAPGTVAVAHLLNHALALSVGAQHLVELGQITREEFAALLVRRGDVLQASYGKGKAACEVVSDILLGRVPRRESEEARETLAILEACADGLPWEFEALRKQASVSSSLPEERGCTVAPARSQHASEYAPSDTTFIVRLHNRTEHVSLRLHLGFWESVRVQLVCDGSTAETVEQLRSLTRESKHIEIHSYTPNRGIARARAIGFEQVSTPYAAVCDDDDYISGASAFAEKGADVLRSSPDVMMVLWPTVTTVNPFMQPIEEWDLRTYHGKSALELLEMVVRTGRIRQMGGGLFRTEEIRALPVDDLFTHAEDLVMLARLCAGHPQKRVHVLEEGSCSYVRLAHADAGSQTGGFTPEKIALAMLAYTVGAYYLIEAGRMTVEDLIEVFAYRGRVFQEGNGIGLDSADVMAAFLLGQKPENTSEEARRVIAFLDAERDRLPAEVRALLARAQQGEDCLMEQLAEGEACLQQGDHVRALSSFEAILKVRPDFAPALNDVGLAFAGMDMAEEAASFFERAVQADPALEVALFNLVDLLAPAAPRRAAELFARYVHGIPDSEEKQQYASLLAQVCPDAVPDVHRAKIAIVCGPDRKFIRDIEQSLSAHHEVRTVYYDREPDFGAMQSAMDWADVTWFEWLDSGFVNASRRLRKTSKVICRLHRYEAFTPLGSQVNPAFLDCLVLVAPLMEPVVRERFPELTKRVPVRVVLNGVDTERFSFEERQPGHDLAYVGYIHGRKNPSLLLQCLHALVQKDRRYRLHIAGVHQDPAFELYWNHAIERMRLKDHVVMHGWVGDMELWLKDKHYLISTSVHESFGYGIAEAMSRGIKPLIHWFPGAETLFPEDLLFLTTEDFVAGVHGRYDSTAYRRHIEANYGLEQQMDGIEALIEELHPSKAAARSWPGQAATPARHHFQKSATYWEERYASGGNSGAGSYGRLAEFKAEVLNRFVKEKGISSVVELGCGDGHQLSLAEYPAYTGIDVSESAIQRCATRFGGDCTKTFVHLTPASGRDGQVDERADLALSLDVIFHLVEDDAFEAHMAQLFASAVRYVAIYANDTDEQPPGMPPHVRFRRFSGWIAANAPEWRLARHIPNRYPVAGSILNDPEQESPCDFFIYERASDAAADEHGSTFATIVSGDGAPTAVPVVDDAVRQQFLDPALTPDNADRYISRTAIVRAVREVAPRLSGTVLDIGCGRMPYRSIIEASPAVRRYVGLDLGTNHYAGLRKPDLTWDGRRMPLGDESIDAALATEVMEHVPEPDAFLRETARVLRKGGLFVFTVPFFWPLHDVPHDEWRYTPFSLRRLLEEGGFEAVSIQALGGWNASLAQMIGLWLKRAPMDAASRRNAMQQLFPLYRQLVETDRIPEQLGESTMITGLVGTAIRA